MHRISAATEAVFKYLRDELVNHSLPRDHALNWKNRKSSKKRPREVHEAEETSLKV